MKKTEQPGEAVNSQEQMVNIKNFKMLHFENLELFINLKSKTFLKITTKTSKMFKIDEKAVYYFIIMSINRI